MRRVTLAALSAALALSACSDESRSPTEPTVEPPAENFSTTCTVTRFPLLVALSQIKTVFPSAPLRSQASLRAGTIALLWNTCHATQAQAGAIDFVKWMSQQALPTSKKAKAAQAQLIVTMLSGVELLDLPSTATEGPDFGIGVYDHTKTSDQYFTTAGGTAATKLPPGLFSEFTTIVISRSPDAVPPFDEDFDGPQFPPFFDYNAINASGNHFFDNDLLATIAFCQLPETETFQYPEFADIKIGHKKPARLTPPEPAAFELLDPEAVPADLAALLDCDNLETASASFGALHNLARATGRSLAPIARALFMPAPLQAATVVGFTGPISTKTGSFSPFGIVEFTGTSTTTTITDDSPDPSQQGGAISVSFSVTPDGEAEFAPTGDVVVSDGNGATCTATIDAGDCLLTPSEAGTITITAEYEGDENFAGSSDTEQHVVVANLGANVYGVNSNDDGLSTIDLTTGAVSFIGRLSSNLNLYATPIAMAVSPASNTIYVWNNSGDGTTEGASTGVLLTVNPTTGQATPVSATTPGQGSLGALAFSPNGALFGINSELFSVNPTTGVKTLIGPLGMRVVAADFDCSGTLYGVEFSTTSQRLVTINVVTGAATAVAILSQNVGLVQSIFFTQSGTLVGAASGAPGILFDINPSTGAVSNIRSTDLMQGLGGARSCIILQ
jgi:hypothetical protein